MMMERTKGSKVIKGCRVCITYALAGSQTARYSTPENYNTLKHLIDWHSNYIGDFDVCTTESLDGIMVGRPVSPRLTSKRSSRYYTKALMRQTRGVIEATEKDETREARGGGGRRSFDVAILSLCGAWGGAGPPPETLSQYNVYQ
ncbi:jg4052 [Pararge aegeria aegeria]|uniref:Jg4052 protein n=1 Tax=Pararge aegeria aegeria TaxID=348720 RepID=A0A8S4R783_9NEOP|nr:jg4052 [Pararge aegeria aegeria]